MTDTPRCEYRLDLTHVDAPDTAQSASPAAGARHLANPPDGAVMREVRASDASALAELMLDAYSGTTDDENGTLDDAAAEVHRFLDGEYGDPMLGSSFVCESGERILSAVLTSHWCERDTPFICFAMTSTASKRIGLGTALLSRALSALRATGASEVRAVITRGNTPSEQLFMRTGFEEVK